MKLSLGDVVRTPAGHPYTISRLFTHLGRDEAGLTPLVHTPMRHRSTALVMGLTLIRTRELSLAQDYSAEAAREGIEAWQADRYRRWAAYWLGRAIERNDDPQAALHLASDNLNDLEGSAA